MAEQVIGKPYRKFVSPHGAERQTFSVEPPSADYDWTLISLDKVKFRVHSSALMSQSDYFAALCTSEMSEQLNHVVEFPDVDSVALERLLTYLCSGAVVVGPDCFLSLVQVASRFQCQSLTDILQRYLDLDFLNINQGDISEIFVTRVHLGMVDVCRRKLEKHLVKNCMVDLYFEVVADMLQRDEIRSSSEDEILCFVERYIETWKLDPKRQIVLLNFVRLPRLTCGAFERAAIHLRGFKETTSFEIIANSKSHRHEIIDQVDEIQLRPRVGHEVNMTMMWIKTSQLNVLEMDPDEAVTWVKSFRVKAQGAVQTVTSQDYAFKGRKLPCREDIFSSGAFVTYANHVYCLTRNLRFERLTFKKDGPVLTPQTNRIEGIANLAEILRIVGIDPDRENFFVSCRTSNNIARLSVLKCRVAGDDVVIAEPVTLPTSVSKISAKRVTYCEDFICVLTNDNEVYVYTAADDTMILLPAADNFLPKYLQIARKGHKLYVFDYSECPVHLHDFSQPFSHFDRIRVYDLSLKKWIANYDVSLNKLRQNGYNELIGFNIDMYFIRGRLYFLWTYQGRLHIFLLEEHEGNSRHLFDHEIPSGANGVILLPGYFKLRNDSTVLETYMNSYCLKKMKSFGEDRETARKVAEWGEKYFDGVVGSGLFPFD